MNILVVGSGAREHAITWKLAANPQVDSLFVTPGNAGTAALATNVQPYEGPLDLLVTQVREHDIDLTIVGPETPLAAGIVDRFQQLGLPIFGPTRAAACIETSKVYAKTLMQRLGVPTADFKVFCSYSEGRDFLESHEGPMVIKADGLAAGKGVFVCDNREQALAALYDCMEDRIFGMAGESVLVEERLYGEEVSVFAFVDGEHLSSMIAACDYKRLLDCDEGPNTGGMGSYSPPYFWTYELANRIRIEIMEPVVRALAEEGTPYKGVLYAGLMITPDGPKVVEFNCRLGDPEAQIILPLLRTDLGDIALACIEGRLADLPIQWASETCVGVVMASGGYPGDYSKGLPIAGLDDLDKEMLLFHGGTRLISDASGERVVTDGGRVLTVTGMGDSLSQAREGVYRNVERIHFTGAHYRKDIALIERTAVL